MPADTAALMNERFINIKVDREERPDIDAIYQKVVQLMGQGGGWPLTFPAALDPPWVAWRRRSPARTSTSPTSSPGAR